MAVEARLDIDNRPFVRGGSGYHKDNETVAQDAGRATAMAINTVMYQDPSDRKWYPLTAVTAGTPGRMVCGAFGSTPALMQAITDGSFTISIDGVSMDIDSLDFSVIEAPTDTQAKLVCGANGANLAAWQAVTDGSFQFTVNGVAFDLTTLDFSLITALDEVVDVIEAEAGGQQFKMMYDSDADVYSFASLKHGEESTITVLTAGSAGTDISGAGFLNGLTGTGTATQGTGGDVWMTDMAEVINEAGLGRYTALWDGTKFTFVSNTQGLESSVSVLSATGAGTDISGASFLNGLTGTGTATAGTAGQFPMGILRTALTAAAIVAGDVTGVDIITGGAKLALASDQVVYENSLTRNSVCAAINKTIEGGLNELGIFLSSTVDVASYENA
jgi:hypothetical protein